MSTNERQPIKDLQLTTDQTYLVASDGRTPVESVDLGPVVSNAEANTTIQVDIVNKQLVYTSEKSITDPINFAPTVIPFADIAQTIGLSDLENVEFDVANNGDILVYDYTSGAWKSYTIPEGDIVSQVGVDEAGKLVKGPALSPSGDTVAIPIAGSIVWPGSEASIPAGFVIKDGRELNRAIYATLFSIIGTTYGAGDGSTTFNIPNTKSRTIVTVDPAVTELNARGKTTGAREEVMTWNQMPAHNHGVNDPGHSHGLSRDVVATSGGGNNRIAIGGGGQQVQWSVTGIYGSGTGISTQVAGANQPHSLMQPTIAEYWIMRIA